MAKHGGSKIRKRETLPSYYTAPRKMYTFAVNVRPGAHSKELALDPVTLIRDILKLGRTLQEIKKTLSLGMLLVNGKKVTDHKTPLGLMDVIHIKDSDLYYRLLPYNGKALYPVSIDKGQSDYRILRITRKTALRGGKYQYTCHDGSNFVIDTAEYRPGDSLLVSNADGKIINHYPLKKDSYALIFKGRRVGIHGRIIEVVPGTMTRKSMVKIAVSNSTITVPKDYVIVIGKEKPAISLPVGELP